MSKVEWHGDMFMERITAGEQSALAELGERMATEAARRAPVDTGALRDSIRSTGVQRKGSGYRVGVEATAPYALPVETGHRTASGSFVAGQPYLRPAFDIYAPQFVALLRRYIA